MHTARKPFAYLLPLCICILLHGPALRAQVASDNAGNYASGIWTNGSTAGFGFSAWTLSSSSGTGNAGTFIGNPSSAGISGMNPSSFGFYANPLGSGANAEVSRQFSSPLTVGQSFSFLWGLNWDSDSPTSNRGFNLRSGAVQLININMSNSATIVINGSPMFTQYGAQAFTLNFEQLTPTSIRVSGIGRNGLEAYGSIFSGLAGPADGFSFYFNATSVPPSPSQDFRQMYMNDLQIVPEPQKSALLGLAAAGMLALRTRRLRRMSR